MPAASGQRTVLLISHAFPPMGGIAVQRPLKFAQYLRRHGWRVMVLTTKGAYTATPDPSLVDAIPSDVTVLRVSDPIAHWMGRVIRRRARPDSAENTTSAPPLHILEKGPGQPAQKGTTTRAPARAGRFREVRRWLGALAAQGLKHAKQTLLVPDEAVWWAVRAAVRARRLVRTHGIDCIYTTSGPHSTHLAGWWVHHWTGIPWVADFRDPWTDNFQFHHTGLRRRLEEAMERRVFREASCIITVTDGFADLFRRKYPGYQGKVQVIRNGVDPTDFPVSPPALAASPRGARPLSFPVVMFYAGILYPGRSPNALFQAVRTLMDEGLLAPDALRLQFAGVFDYPGRCENACRVRELGLESVVEILGYRPRHEVLRRMVDADILLLIGEETEAARDYVPGKLYEYLWAGRPILALLPEGEAATLIRQARAGVVASPTDPEAIARALVALLNSAREWTPAPSHLEQYTRQTQAAQLAAILDRLVMERHRGHDVRSKTGDKVALAHREGDFA
jgi:glycosyltransferase involved in cell wall biosynthesis